MYVLRLWYMILDIGYHDGHENGHDISRCIKFFPIKSTLPKTYCLLSIRILLIFLVSNIFTAMEIYIMSKVN